MSNGRRTHIYKLTIWTAVGFPTVPAICADWTARVRIIEGIDDIVTYAFIGIAGTCGTAMCETETCLVGESASAIRQRVIHKLTSPKCHSLSGFKRLFNVDGSCGAGYANESGG